ncbi:hypothetical protein Ciccas_008402 [Cichlidogyrus casuarinus]|uniref:Tudor domain-containing protein n=1 Tax=Cichlidogyrus casuarinus TaxID=1844966 RepID=A0ABD2Q0J9_9PLAT
MDSESFIDDNTVSNDTKNPALSNIPSNLPTEFKAFPCMEEGDIGMLYTAKSFVEVIPSKAPDKSDFKVGDNVVAMWSEDEEYYFGKIVQIAEDSEFSIVKFYHYGNLDEVDTEHILEINDESSQLVQDQDNKKSYEKQFEAKRAQIYNTIYSKPTDRKALLEEIKSKLKPPLSLEDARDCLAASWFMSGYYAGFIEVHNC